MTIKESVLEALNLGKGQYISGEKLSEQLGVSRAAVWKAIRSLREEGYRIDAVTNRGYCMQRNFGALTEEDIRRYLPAAYRENGLQVYDVIDSTNNRARQLADREDPEKLHGTTIVARQQTAGKGRLGRSFFSPKDGIYLSIIVKPHFDQSQSLLVTVAAATAVAEAIQEVSGHETQIKWVNDIYIDGRKVCGILTEGITDFESGSIDHLVIGIGINTNLAGFPEELMEVAGAVEGDYDRSQLAAQVIGKVLRYVEDLTSGTFLEAYRQRSILIGRDIRVFKGVYRKDPEHDLTGIPARALGIDAQGGLQVMYTDGRRETLTTGEVTVRL